MAPTAVHQSVGTDYHKGPPAQGRAGVQNSDGVFPGSPGAVSVDTVPVKHVSSSNITPNRNPTDGGKTTQGIDANGNYAARAEASTSDSRRVERKRGKVLTSIAALAVGLASLGIRIAELIEDSM